jgi:hypothetical protein
MIVLVFAVVIPAFGLEKDAIVKPEKMGAPIPRNARQVSISRLDSESEKWEGERVLVLGRIESQCGHGRWFWIGSDEGGEPWNRYQCGCSGGTWEQPALTKKVCPHCGAAMPDCGTKTGTFHRSLHRVYVDGAKVRIAPRVGRRVRVYGIVSLPMRRNPGPWILARGVEISPPDPAPLRNLWKCACTGKTWEQPVSEKKAYPYCGPAMPHCGDRIEVILGRKPEPVRLAGCEGCDQKPRSGGCGGCGGGGVAPDEGRCSENRCNDCRGDDSAGTKCSPPAAAKTSEGGAGAGKPQTHCPVMGGPVNRDVFVVYRDWKVYFCCPGCDRSFGEDPEKYLRTLRASGVVLEQTK